MQYIGIVDSGSTKADWIFLDENGSQHHATQTPGLNPLLLEIDDIPIELNSNSVINEIKNDVVQIYFYGAGCKAEKPKNQLQLGLQKFFYNAHILINTDLMAACLAVYQGEPCLVAILGTGSNVCYFDGKSAKSDIPSLGFILGDEGSGNHIGRVLLQSFFYKKMPSDLSAKFANQYNLELDFVLEKLYKQSKVNAYLAQFSRFAQENMHHPFMIKLITNCFQIFVDNLIMPQNYTGVKINFVGSIAYHFKPILELVLDENNLQLGTIIQKPIEELVAYHSHRLK